MSRWNFQLAKSIINFTDERSDDIYLPVDRQLSKLECFDRRKWQIFQFKINQFLFTFLCIWSCLGDGSILDLIYWDQLKTVRWKLLSFKNTHLTESSRAFEANYLHRVAQKTERFCADAEIFGKGWNFASGVCITVSCKTSLLHHKLKNLFKM